MDHESSHEEDENDHNDTKAASISACPWGRPRGDPFLGSRNTRMQTTQLIENKSSSAYIVSFLLWQRPLGIMKHWIVG